MCALIFVLFALIINNKSFVTADNAEIVCLESLCEDFDCTNAVIPDNCNVQNATHNGIFLPFPGPCNCCDYCLENLDQGDSCHIGEPGVPPGSTVCGNLLFCTEQVDSETTGTCEQLTSECTMKQAEYDEKVLQGQVGHLEVREICNRRGLFENYKCIPGEICYCTSKDGKRLFGEISYTTLADHLFNCACSRAYNDASEFMGGVLHTGEYLRCQSNGDYDTIQCINDDCICVDAVDGAPTFSNLVPVNSSSISNETMPCFNFEMHVEGEYYRPCEQEYIDLLETISDFEDGGSVVLGAIFPNCQLDGFYAPVQFNDTHYFCSDPYGNVLEDFVIDKEDELVAEMTCVCARSRSITNGDKPECCPNGNYRPIQCRRGLCRCVDPNGNQIEKEVALGSKWMLPCSDLCVPEVATTTTGQDL